MPHIDVRDCVLVVIDAQAGFYSSARTDVDRRDFAAALLRAAWVCSVGTALGIPAVVTEEDAATNGPTTDEVLAAVPVGTPVFAKAIFGANDDPAIDEAVRSSGASMVVLVGLETDVCVAQSALGWREAGFRVAVVRDAVYSAGPAHAYGLARLAAEGIELISAKELYYEWMRTLPAGREFEAQHPGLAAPPGFSL